ncbi:hypothetical protein QE439_004029 [Pedobacter agri]|nr:hypothetical protein [Pedobacter agri]
MNRVVSQFFVQALVKIYHAKGFSEIAAHGKKRCFRFTGNTQLNQTKILK